MVELKNLQIGYNDKVILSNISAEMHKGELIGLLGENATGKSTLMKTLLKIISPISGTITCEGKNQNEYSQREWATLFSAVSSNQEVVPAIPVKELILLGDLPNRYAQNKNKNLKTQKLEQISDWLNIKPLLNRLANELSDGQIQKVFIARALMQDTPYVLFDEPTAHLDYKGKFTTFDLLADLAHKTKKCFLVATHELELALETIDKIWLIKEGEFYTGIPEEVVWEQDLYGSLQTYHFRFDYEQGKFTNSKPLEFPVDGEPKLAYWVKHFAQRNPEKFDGVKHIKVGDKIRIINKNQTEVVLDIPTFFKTFTQ